MFDKIEGYMNSIGLQVLKFRHVKDSNGIGIGLRQFIVKGDVNLLPLKYSFKGPGGTTEECLFSVKGEPPVCLRCLTKGHLAKS